ncbi:MAG: hypothetical protein IKK43_00580 [Clostridia bacterium]|nr:hypothetical protein [Clostridia bacterium]
MKKTKVYTETLKEFIRKRPKKAKDIISVVLAIIISVILVCQICPDIPDDATMIESKQVLMNYIEDPISNPVDTQKYSLHISNGIVKLYILNSDAFCTASLQEDSTYSYIMHTGSLETILQAIWATLIFAVIFYLVVYGLITFFCWLFPIVRKFSKHVADEYRVAKAKAEFNISEQEARENPKHMQLKAEFDRAYKKGYNEGFTKGRKEGFVEGKEDAYEYGYTNGYNAAQENDDGYKTFEEIEAYLNDENTPS